MLIVCVSFLLIHRAEKKRKEGTKELQWPGTKKICVQKEDKNSSNRFSLRFSSSPLILHSLVIISFFCAAQANDFSINFWWKLEPQHSCSRQNSFCYSFLPQCFRLSFSSPTQPQIFLWSFLLLKTKQKVFFSIQRR